MNGDRVGSLSQITQTSLYIKSLYDKFFLDLSCEVRAMNLRQVEAFKAVMTEGSVTQAAVALEERPGREIRSQTSS